MKAKKILSDFLWEKLDEAYRELEQKTESKLVQQTEAYRLILLGHEEMLIKLGCWIRELEVDDISDET